MVSQPLITFVKVAQDGSFAKAAESLFISPNAVMKQINQLEQRIGTKLLIRTNHGVQLSQAGQSLYKDARFVLQYTEKAMERARQAAGQDTCVIRVGDSLLNPCALMLGLWNKVTAIRPEFKMEMVSFMDNTGSMATVPHTIGIDFDILVGPYDKETCKPDFNILPLGESKRCIAVPIGHALAGKEKLRLDDLFGERLMMIQRGTSRTVDAIRNDLSKNYPEIQIEDVHGFYDIGVFNYCERTGCLLLSMDIWGRVHPLLVTIPVEWNYITNYGIKYPIRPSSPVERFIHVAEEMLSPA